MAAGIPPAALDVYRLARRMGTPEKDCHFAAIQAVLYLWPWLGEEPASVLAREIILYVSREYAEWFWR